MNLEETVIYFGLEGELLCGSISVLLCVQYFQYEGWFWYGCQLSLSSEYTGHCPLDGWLVLGCLEPKLDVNPGFIFAPRCHCPVQGRVRSPVVGVEPLWVGWIKLALECMPCPKEGDRRSKYDRDVTADLGTSYLYRHWQLHPEAAEACIPFSAVFIQVQCEAVVRLGWGSGWLQQLRWLSCCLDSGLPLCRLLPEPVCPRAGVNCRVMSGGARVLWEMNLCVPLPRGCQAASQCSLQLILGTLLGLHSGPWGCFCGTDRMLSLPEI